MRKIGILGGMGPEATILLQSRLLQAVEAQDDADHIPLLVDMNSQVPSRLDWILENKGINPGPVLAQMALSLERMGADAIAMPCNTAHHFAPDIQKAIEIPFFNMPELAAASVIEAVGEGGKVGILGSPANQITRLFDDVFSQYGCDVVFPENKDVLLSAIRSIKSNGPDANSALILQEESDKLVAKGVKCIVIGCSEFSLLSGRFQPKVPAVDTLDVLVNHLVAFSGAKSRKVS